MGRQMSKQAIWSHKRGDWRLDLDGYMKDRTGIRKFETKKGVIWCHGAALPLANERGLCFFSQAQFLITWQSGRTHPPAICSRNGANYGRMSRQFPDNRQCCRETIVPTPALSLSIFCYFCWWWYISLCLKYGSILGAGAHYSLLRSCRDSIPPSVCWTCHQQRPAQPHWTLPFLFCSFFFCPSIKRFQLRSRSFLPKNITENICNWKEHPKKNNSHFN